MDFDLLRQIGGLQADANTILELLALGAGIESEDRNFSPAAGPQAFENLDCGCLAGSVRTQQAEDFACVDFEIDALDGGEVAVILGEGADLNQRWDEGMVLP